MSEPNVVKWVGVQDTEPVTGVTVKQATPSNLKATVTQESNIRQIYAKRPASATQIVKSASVQNNQVVLHTVTENKTFYLAASFISAYLLAPGLACIYVWSNVGIPLYSLSHIPATATTAPFASMSFIPPLEIPAGYQIRIISQGAGLEVIALVFGYEE